MAIEEQIPEVLFAMLLFGEARGEPFSGKVAVGSVVRNRTLHPRWWGHNLREVILKPFQFSCFNFNDPNREKLLVPWKWEDYPVYDECYEVAIGILENDLPDNTRRSDHYYSIDISPPRWARPECKTVQIGGFSFYRLEI